MATVYVDESFKLVSVETGGPRAPAAARGGGFGPAVIEQRDGVAGDRGRPPRGPRTRGGLRACTLRRMDGSPRLVVGITGASGAIYGIRLLERLRELDVETHLIASRWSRVTIEDETPYSFAEVKKLADEVHAENDLAAPVSSGSFLTRGMVIAPCTVKTLAAVATGFSHNLVAPRGRRDAQGAPSARARRARDAALEHPPPEHAHALGARRDDPAAGPGLLPPARRRSTTSSTRPCCGSSTSSGSTSTRAPRAGAASGLRRNATNGSTRLAGSTARPRTAARGRDNEQSPGGDEHGLVERPRHREQSEADQPAQRPRDAPVDDEGANGANGMREKPAHRSSSRSRPSSGGGRARSRRNWPA